MSHAACLEASLAEMVARHNVPGVSLAVLEKGEIRSATAGMSNISTGAAVTPETVMHIGSICKLFNATLVMQLVDDSLLDLDEPIVAYLPSLDWADAGAARKITVRMLLNHTSGIDGALFPDHGPDEESIEKGVRRIAAQGMLFSPGSEFSYCNGATVIAGYIAQLLRKQSWYTLVRERVFDPLEMHHAVALPQDALLFNAGVGHYLGGAGLVRTSRALLPQSFAPGGTTLMMSAADLIRFAAMHLGKGVGMTGARILSEQSAEAMQAMTVNNAGKAYVKYDLGLGWMRTPDGLLNHNGGAPGVVSSLYVHPQTGFAVAVLTNGEHGRGMIDAFLQPVLSRLSRTNVAATLDEDYVAAPLDGPADLYAGRYEDVVAAYRVVVDQGRLLLSARTKFAYYDSVSTEETDAFALDPVGDDRFLWRASAHIAGPDENWGRLFTFRGRDGDGRMQRIGNKNLLFSRRGDT